MKKKVFTFLALCLMTVVAFPGLYSSARTQSATDGYWAFEKAEQMSTVGGMSKDDYKTSPMPLKPFDIKKLEGFHTEDTAGYHRGRRTGVTLTKLEVPETIKADALQAVISGSGYATLVKELIQQTLGSPPSNPTNFFKFKVEHDATTASGQKLSTLMGHVSGYDHVVHSEKQEDFDFSTAGLSVPHPPEDFTVRLLFVFDDENGSGILDTWILLFHYKWRLGAVTGAAAAGETPTEPRYLGCYKDTSALDLNGYLERSRSNTPQSCIAICRDRGFKYAAVQYGESCLCGNSYGKYGSATNCDYKCTGDPNQICGGYSTNSVYQIK